MRILHLVDRWSERGGAFVHLMAVVDALTRTSHRVTVAAGKIEAPSPQGARLVQVDALASRLPQPVHLGSLVREHDLVHVHTLMNPEALEAVVDAPALATVQDHRVFCPGQGRVTADGRVCVHTPEQATCAACFEDRDYADSIWALTRRRQQALLRFQRVCVLSHYMAHELAGVGFPSERLVVIPPFPYRLDRAATAAGQPCVLFAGRLSRTKGVWDAVAAWRGAELDLPLVFAGTGPERPALEAEGFEVLGWLDRSRMAATYRRARVVIFPPRWQEPYGIVGMEAASMGVPVAAWASGGIEDWHGPARVAWGDLAGLSARLRALAKGQAVDAPPRLPNEASSMARLFREYLTISGLKGHQDSV